jgi:pimeloyl-ACP methyl ester carboxylesterase/DNA-binding CsgD family transcriptional regulator
MEPIRFATSSDGTRLAYAVTGSGTPLIKAPNWITHLEHDRGFWGHWVDALSARHTFVRFDQRGCGLSDREPAEISFDAWVRDLEAVADAAGYERFGLLGISQGAAIAIAYAARHAERVTHLVLYGGYVRGKALREMPSQQRELHATLGKLIELGWGGSDPSFRQVFAAQFMPGASPERSRAFNDMMRVSATPEVALRIYNAVGDIDVRDKAPRVSTPALVAHAREDRRVPFEEGRALAAMLPNSHFVPLDSPNHLLTAEEPAWHALLAAIDAFTADSRVPEGRFAALTARERDVLDAVAQGLDNAQIAARLGMSEKTVRNHLTAILPKLGAETRAQAIVQAREAGFGRRPR